MKTSYGFFSAFVIVSTAALRDCTTMEYVIYRFELRDSLGGTACPGPAFTLPKDVRRPSLRIASSSVRPTCAGFKIYDFEDRNEGRRRGQTGIEVNLHRDLPCRLDLIYPRALEYDSRDEVTRWAGVIAELLMQGSSSIPALTTEPERLPYSPEELQGRCMTRAGTIMREDTVLANCASSLRIQASLDASLAKRTTIGASLPNKRLKLAAPACCGSLLFLNTPARRRSLGAIR